MNKAKPIKNPLRQYLFFGGGAVFLIVAIFLYFSGGRIVSTDDAFVQAARVDISANIAGRVTKILVKENQQVRKGDPLYELDDRDYVIALKDATAKLSNAKLQYLATQATYMQHQANVREAEATLLYQQHEVDRQKNLNAKGISSQAQLDLAEHTLADATQKLSAEKEAEKNIRSLLGDDPTITINNHPSVQQAQAMLERAQLNLSYTIVKAPMDGIVSKVDLLQPGQYVNTATPVFALISNSVVWVEANFKETELTNMLPGQQATVEIDAYPDRTFHGSVESLSSGTGSSFSLLPPENATGNWVKVVQRLPVRINITDLDPKWPLHSGLSVVVKVDTLHSRLKDFWK